MKLKLCVLKVIEKALFSIALISLFICAFFGASVSIQKKYVYPLKYKEEVFLYADNYGLNRSLVFATIKVESGFDKNAESRKGAVGLMQISPDTARFIGEKLNVSNYDLKDENTNILFGCYYLKYLIDKFKSVNTAVVAFNAGEGNVINWLKNYDMSKDGKELFYIPFKESREYVKKIEKCQTKYESLYGKILDKQ